MWEISISVSYKFKKYLDFLKINLMNKLERNIICASVKIENDYVLSLALKDDIKVNEYKKYIKKQLATIIVKLEKEEYLKNRLNLSELQPSFKNALIKALILFDIDQEIKQVMARIDLDKNININAFYQFRLRLLKHKWEDIISLTSQENLYLKNPEVLLEFLKFLIENIPENNFEVTLKKKGDKFLFCNANTYKSITTKDISTENGELDIITNLIVLSPKKIYINCTDNLSEEIVLFLKYLFDKKIKFN